MTACDPLAELAAMRERVEAATPLPWTLETELDEDDGSRFPFAIRTPEPHRERAEGEQHPVTACAG